MKQSDTSSSLYACLKELHLPTVRECYSSEADSARQESLSYSGCHNKNDIGNYNGKRVCRQTPSSAGFPSHEGV